MTGIERGTADCAGGRLSYRAAGPQDGAPALLLMHGVGGNSRSFGKQLAGLSDRFRVIAWDAPGYGDSALREPSLARYSAAVFELLDALEIDRAHLLGHSMGGVVAQGAAGLAPDRVGSLILSSTFTGYHQAPGSPLAESWQARLRDIRTLSPAEFGRARARSMLAESAPDPVRAEAASIAGEVRHDGLKAASEMLHVADTRAIARALALPVLVIIGQRDRIIAPSLSTEMAGLIAGARIVEIPETGHAAYLEDPAAYNESLNGFLA
jgi:pimeloyl-ACP methyl ester carboxylesterase